MENTTFDGGIATRWQVDQGISGEPSRHIDATTHSRRTQKGRGCPRPSWEYSVARPFQPRLVSPRPPLGSYAEILSIVVVICDIHKLSDEPFPEGISGRTSPNV